MRLKYSISAFALISALAVTAPAFAQLGVSVGGDDGLSVGVDVGTDDGLDVDADAGVGDVDAGADVSIGGGSDDQSDSDPLVDAEVDAGIGGSDGVDVDVDAELLGGESVDIAPITDAPTEPSSDGGASEPVDETARVDLLVSLLGDSSLAEADLDAAIDDRRVAIIEVDDVFTEDSLARIDVALGENGENVEDVQAAIDASVELSAILARENVATEDVIALNIGDDGATEVFVDAEIGSSARQALAADAQLGVGAGLDGAESAQAEVSADIDVGISDASGDGTDDSSGSDDGSSDDGSGGSDGSDGDGSDGGTDAGAGDGTEDTGSGNADGTDDDISEADDGATDDVAAAALVETMACPADLEGLVGASVSAAEVGSATSARIVELTDCSSPVSAPASVEVLTAIEDEPVAASALEAQDLSVDDVVDVTIEDETLVLYVTQ